MDNNYIETIRTAAGYVKQCIGERKPLIGIVLGSGLGNLGDSIEDSIVIPYKDIPGFPVSTAMGHKGNLVVGTLGGKCVLAMQGRFHHYEGYPMQIVTIGIRTMKMLGIEYLFVSNAAGGCNPDYAVGDCVIIKDHINMMQNPLVGPNMEEFGPRFPDMTCAYDLELSAIAEKICILNGMHPHKGVYLATSGPTYETPAEIRFFRAIGADMVGMSTIPEVIVARHCGMRVFGMSVITNMSNSENVVRHLNDGEDVIRQGKLAAERMTLIFTKLIEAL